jgi:hypothetical protein
MATMRNCGYIQQTEFKQHIPHNNNNDNINRYVGSAAYAVGKLTLSLPAGIFSCSVNNAVIT